MSDWQTERLGAGDWLAHLANAELAYDIPTDLLVRVAYEESHWIEKVITGVEPSPAGALGIMQLEPPYFFSVRVPVPFTEVDTVNQIDEAAQYLAHLYDEFKDWKLALAAYNAGPSAVRHYKAIPPFKETQDYVAEITADVPVGDSHA